MSDYDFIPLRSIPPGSELANSLLPSIGRTQSMLDSFRSGGGGGHRARASELESGAASIVGAALNGAAQAQGIGPVAIAAVGALGIAGAAYQGHPVAMSAACGLVGPAVAELVRRALTRSTAAAAPTAPPPAPSNPLPRPAPAAA